MNRAVLALLFLAARVEGQPINANLKAGLAAYHAKDGVRAVELLKPLAEKGNAKAQYCLGQVYWEGNNLFPGAKKDKNIGWSWIKKAADSGHADAEYFVGCAYEFGLDQPEDVEAAVIWIRKAAIHGCVPAMGVMGNACWGGDALNGIKRDPKAAMVWFRKAAKKGDAHAMFMIARLYTRGAGVTQDYAEAHAWMNLAAANEKLIPDHYTEERESLARKMTAAQVAKAQMRAAALAKELSLQSSPDKAEDH
jgi:hypothetical protein